MKFQLIFLIITLNNAMQLDQSFPEPIFTLNDYSQCFKELANIAMEVASVVKDINSKNYQDLIVQLMQALKNTYDVIECFKSNDRKSIIKEIYNNYGNYSDDRKNCILQHFQDAAVDFKKVITELTNGDVDSAAQDFDKVVSTLEDIKNC